MSASSTNRSGMLKLWLLNLFANAAASGSLVLLAADPRCARMAGRVVGGSGTRHSAVRALAARGNAGLVQRCRVSQPARNWRAFCRGLRHVVPLANLGGAGRVHRLDHSERRQLCSAVLGMDSAEGECRAVAAECHAWFRLAALRGAVDCVACDLGCRSATTIAAAGFSGRHIARSFRVLRQPLYWISLCVLMALGVWVPYKLVTWVPDLKTLRQQAWSAGLRFAARPTSSLITAFILLIWMVGERTDREDPIV